MSEEQYNSDIDLLIGEHLIELLECGFYPRFSVDGMDLHEGRSPEPVLCIAGRLDQEGIEYMLNRAVEVRQRRGIPSMFKNNRE